MMETSVRAVVMGCPEEGCEHMFSLPAEVLSSEDATRGTITFTVRVDATGPEGLLLVNHYTKHWPELTEEEDA